MRARLLTLLLLLSLPATAGEPRPHRAAAAAEKFLEGVLQRFSRDEALLDSLLPRPGGKPAKAALPLTPALVGAIRAAEKAAVAAECGGTYRDGMICGLEYHPILCAQDAPPSFLFRSIGPDRIRMYWPDQPDPVATYQVLADGAGWKLDGVDCGEAGKFNIKDR